MSLFTSPVTLADGVPTDHIFAQRNQINGLKTKQFGSEWIESAAASSIDSKLMIKHDESAASVRRRLLQYRFNALILDGVTYKPITTNFTVTYHPEHTDTQVSVGIDVVQAALAIAGFNAAFLEGQL